MGPGLVALPSAGASLSLSPYRPTKTGPKILGACAGESGWSLGLVVCIACTQWEETAPASKGSSVGNPEIPDRGESQLRRLPCDLYLRTSRDTEVPL